jgi:hypothetical protein
MLLLQDAVSTWVLVYFLLMIIFGSFFLVNLALAVLYLQFTKEFSLTPAASRATSRAISKAASSAATRTNSYAAGKPGQRLHLQDAQQLQQRLQRAWLQEEEQQEVCAATQSGSGGSEDQCPQQQQAYGMQGAHAHQFQQQAGNEVGLTSLSAGGGQHMAQHSQQSAAIRQVLQCDEGAGEVLGSCQGSLPGGLELPAAASPKRLPPLPGSPRVTKDRVTGEVSFACDAGSLPGSWSGSGGSPHINKEGAAEQDFVTARVIVSRRTNSKMASWASLEQPHPAVPHPPEEPAHRRVPRAAIKPLQHRQQQQQPVEPSNSTGGWQHLRTCMWGCSAPFVEGWGLLRQKCRELIKVSSHRQPMDSCSGFTAVCGLRGLLHPHQLRGTLV